MRIKKSEKQAQAIKDLAISYSILMEAIKKEDSDRASLWKRYLKEDLLALEKLGIKVEFLGINA